MVALNSPRKSQQYTEVAFYLSRNEHCASHTQSLEHKTYANTANNEINRENGVKRRDNFKYKTTIIFK